MLAFDWLHQTVKIGCIYLHISLWEWLVQSYAARSRLVRTYSSTLCQNWALENSGNWVLCLWHQHISKMGYFKCTILFNFCTISFYLVMTLVVPCLDNIFMVFLISELAKIGTTKPICLDSGSLGGRVFFCMRGHGLLSLYIHVLNSSKKLYFLCL